VSESSVADTDLYEVDFVTVVCMVRQRRREGKCLI